MWENVYCSKPNTDGFSAAPLERGERRARSPQPAGGALGRRQALGSADALLADRRRAPAPGVELQGGAFRLGVQGLVACLRPEQGPPVPFGAVGFSFDGTEVPPDQFGLLPAWLAVRIRLLPGGASVGVLGDPQSLELDLDVFGGAALRRGLRAVLVLVAQDVTLFDEAV